MYKLFHKHFIPSETNDHHPHFLRLRVLLALFAMIILLEGTYLLGIKFILPANENFAAIFASVLVDQTNTKRTVDRIGTLTTNTKLEVAARLKAEDMAAKGYFAHNSPDGKTPWHWFEKAGYDYTAAGENLAVNFTDSADVTNAWMRSPLHRANILNGNYKEIGIATASGIYKGKELIFIVQMFGRESPIARPNLIASTTSASLAGLIDDVVAPIVSKVATNPIAPRVAPTTSRPVALSLQVPVSIPQIKNNISELPTSTAVAGVEVQKLTLPEDAYIEIISDAPVTPSSFDVMFASPHRTTNMFYLLLFMILTIAIGIVLFVNARVKHSHVVVHGLTLLAVVTLVIVLNSVLGRTSGLV